MQPLQPATPAPHPDSFYEELVEKVNAEQNLGDEIRDQFDLAPGTPLDISHMRAFIAIESGKYVLWKNDTYQVAEYDWQPAITEGWPPIKHLSLKRLDREPITDWRDKQAIKNQIVGPEYEAVEIYPAESRLVDGANQYHLWVLGDRGDEPAQLPFGFFKRSVSDTTLSSGKQRPRD